MTEEKEEIKQCEVLLDSFCQTETKWFIVLPMDAYFEIPVLIHGALVDKFRFRYIKPLPENAPDVRGLIDIRSEQGYHKVLVKQGDCDPGKPPRTIYLCGYAGEIPPTQKPNHSYSVEVMLQSHIQLQNGRRAIALVIKLKTQASTYNNA